MPAFLERLQKPGPILMDGATGTELERRGLDSSTPIWSALALLEAPKLVEQVHREYLRAGAELLTANTFRTQRRALGKLGMGDEAARLAQLAVSIAQQAAQAEGRPAFIAGSMAPLEDCYTPERVLPDEELLPAHREIARNLAAAGVDLLLVETMNTAREAAAAARAAQESGLPFGVSFVCRDDGHLLSGESIAEAVRAVEPYNPHFLSINCTPAPTLSAALSQLRAATTKPLAAYGNNGHTEDFAGWQHTATLDPHEYASLATGWLESGARLIGGCCGTTPEHIAALKHAERMAA